MTYCDHENTQMYGTSEECLDCGARKHANSLTWHQRSGSHTGPSPNGHRGKIIIDRETGEVLKW